MTRTYTVNIRNLADQSDRALVVESANPMEALKAGYKKTNNKEEIVDISNEEGDVVYSTDVGFGGNY